MLKQEKYMIERLLMSDIYFADKIAKIDLEHEPKTLIECKKRSDWPKWKEAIAAELLSLNKRKVFGHVG